MTSGRFHLNGEADGSEQNSSSSSATTTTTGVASSVGSSASGTTQTRENEKIKSFFFTSRGNTSSLERTERTHPPATTRHIEELEIKIPEVGL